jgi:hypothetical protein
MQQDMHSQQAWSISQHFLSPLVQVTHTPSFVYSHLHIPHTRLHWQTAMPLSVQQQLHIPAASILHRFCKVPQATSSSHLQLIFSPPEHFSIFILQLGKTHQLPGPGTAVGAPAGAAKPCMPTPDRSMNIVLDIE